MFENRGEWADKREWISLRVLLGRCGNLALSLVLISIPKNSVVYYCGSLVSLKSEFSGQVVGGGEKVDQITHRSNIDTRISS